MSETARPRAGRWMTYRPRTGHWMTYEQFWLKVQRRALQVVLPLMLLVVVAGYYQQARQGQQAREVEAFYQEEARRLHSELALCRQPPPRSLREPTREGATHEDVGGSSPPRSLAVPTHEGATLEDVGGTRGSSHWLGTIHHPEQPPRRNGPPEGEAAKP